MPLEPGPAFAPYKNFGPTTQNLSTGGIHFRRACGFLPVSIKITTPFGVVIFIMVEMAGVEPASESTLTGLSPGADDYCGSLTLPVPLPDGKPSRRQVR